MDQDYRQLLIGKVQAETRLEILKEQLGQANNATQHLLLQLGGSGTQCSSQAHARLEVQCERLLQENAELKAMLRLAERRRLPGSCEIASLEDKNISESSDEGSLMDLGEAENEEKLRKSKTEHAEVKTTEQLQKRLVTPTADDTQQRECPDSDGDLLGLAQTTDCVPQPPRAPRRGRLSPGMSEHNRMVSIATWLIDDSEETRFEKWRQMSRNYDLRPVEEYEEYWQCVIRPQFLRREMEDQAPNANLTQHEERSRDVATEKTSPESGRLGIEEQTTIVTEAVQEPVQAKEDVPRSEPLQSDIVPSVQAAEMETKVNSQQHESVQEEDIPPPTENCSFETKTDDRRDSVFNSSFESTDTIFTTSTSTDAVTTDGNLVPEASAVPRDGQDQASEGLMESMHAGSPRQKPVDYSQLLVPYLNTLKVKARETVEMPNETAVADITENLQPKDVPDQVDILDTFEAIETGAVDEVVVPRSQSSIEEQHQQVYSGEPSNSPLEHMPPLRPQDHTTTAASQQDQSANWRSSSPSRPVHPSDGPRNHYDADFEAKLLFFFPKVGEEDSPHLFRTVMIGNIPQDVQLSQVLQNVRGGKIAKASLMATAGFKTTPPIDTNTAMITFANGFCAKKFVEHCKEHPIHLTSALRDNPVQATVEFVLTLTRPLPPYMTRDRDLSRIIYLNIRTPPGQGPHPPKQVLDHLNLEMKFNPPRVPLKYGYDDHGILCIEYASMFDAKAAMDAMRDRRSQMFAGVECGFLEDPCGRPFEREDRGPGEVRERSEETEEGDSAEG